MKVSLKVNEYKEGLLECLILGIFLCKGAFNKKAFSSIISSTDLHFVSKSELTLNIIFIPSKTEGFLSPHFKAHKNVSQHFTLKLLSFGVFPPSS